MSWVPAEQVLRTIAEQKAALVEQQSRVSSFASYHEGERAKLEAEQKQATHDLAQALLPSLDPAVIQSASDTVGLVGLPGENIPHKLEVRRAELASRIAAIERDRRFVDRELLRHPRTGSLSRALAEAEEMRQPAAAIVATCEAHPRFSRLWESGYGAPEFSAPWWRYSYWEDHSAAGDIVALFPGKTSFSEVRDEYRSARETAGTFDGEIARLHAEIAACDALARDHVSLVDEHRHLDERGLAFTQHRITQHLLTTDASLISQRLEPWPAIRLLFLRASGIAAKITYLEGIQRTNIADLSKDLSAQQQRLGDLEFRTRRRWAAMPLDKYQKLAEDRRPRFEKRWQRFGKVYESVHTYDRWDRGRYYDDLLWWDLMTRGRYDGSYVSEVFEFHQRHPDYVFDPDYRALAAADRAADAEARAELDGDAAAAAIAADGDVDGSVDGGGSDFSGVDAS